jgi:vitamin B12 transporter
MKYKLLIVGALFGALSLPFAAYADTPMELLIVTPTRMPEPLDQTIADTTVLDEQDIRKSGAPDVPTLLRSLVGTEVVQTGGLGSPSGVFLRGAASNQALVLLDGVRIDSASTGATALEHIMLDSIERIEVVRGNASGVYGSAAIGGVIQIFTKQGRGSPAFDASAGFGSHGTQRASAGFSGQVNDNSFAVNVGTVKTNGVPAINPDLVPTANPNDAGYRNATINAQVKHAFDAGNALSASVFSTRGNSQWDDGTPTDSSKTLVNIDKFSLSSDNEPSNIWHSQVRASQGRDDSRFYTNDVQTSYFNTRSGQYSWQNEFKIAENQRLSLVIENLQQAVSSDTLLSRNTRNVNSFSGGYVRESGARQVQFSLRQDRYSDFGIANTGLLGYGMSLADGWRVTARVSNAFRAPTLNDLFYPFTDYGGGYTYVGNPDLLPERSQEQEIGLHYAAADQRVDAVYFENRIHDMIAYNSSGTSEVNIDQARIDGLELSYAGDVKETHLKANATWQNPRNVATGQVLQRRAREFGAISASRSFGAWEGGIEMRYSGARPDVDYATYTNVSLPAYQLVNLTAGYRIDKHLNLSLRIDNLFDRDYSEVYSYNTLGRTLFVGLNYQQ